MGIGVGVGHGVGVAVGVMRPASDRGVASGVAVGLGGTVGAGTAVGAGLGVAGGFGISVGLGAARLRRRRLRGQFPLPDDSACIFLFLITAQTTARYQKSPYDQRDHKKHGEIQFARSAYDDTRRQLFVETPQSYPPKLAELNLIHHQKKRQRQNRPRKPETVSIY